MIRRIKIPEERVAILIGKDGKIKKEIEKSTKTKITIEEDVSIEGDVIDVMTAENIVKAVGRGFSPETAIELIDEENCLVIIPLSDDKKQLKRLKSRIIGTRGKCRQNIETYTNTKISIYGKTVAIIGSYENVSIANQAIEKLIKGAGHKSVYKFLESNR